MKNIIRIITISIVLFFAFGLNVSAQELPEPLKPARLVNDYCGVLTKQQSSEIEKILVEIDKTSSTEIAIAIVPTIDGMDMSQYATELARKWGVGGSKNDNGIMIVIKPQGSNSDKGMAYIATGYGLEGAVPDITAKRIIRDEMFPQFQKGRYFEGIYLTVNTLKSLVAGEYTADQYNKKKKSKGNPFGIIIIVVVVMFFIFIGTKSRRDGMDISNGEGRSGAAASVLSSILQVALLMSLGRSSNGFDSFSGGSGSFGDNGGGFDGFGGGDFGGGGAGGEW